MASGLTPVDIHSMIKQHVRWAQGVVQSVRNIHLITNKNLSFGQKIVYLNSYLYWWSFFKEISIYFSTNLLYIARLGSRGHQLLDFVVFLDSLPNFPKTCTKGSL